MEKFCYYKKCEKVFCYHLYLNQQERSNTWMKQYSSDLCGKVLSEHSFIMTHIRPKTKGSRSAFKKNFICTLLKEIPVGEKPSECVQHEKVFDWLSNLTGHKKPQTQRKLCKCKDCQRTFVNQASLNVHTR